MSEQLSEPQRPEGDYLRHRGPELPLLLEDGSDPLAQRALRAYLRERECSAALVGRKVEILRHYNVPQMLNAVAICHWSRSGSILLASYLDGHADVIALPNLIGESIYPFLHDYERLSLWEKLIAYPEYSESEKGNAGSLFLEDRPGNHATSRAHYYAAVRALFRVYGGRTAAWLGTRQRFFQFLHTAYAVANAQRPEGTRPVMVYAQHWFNERLARQFLEDFPCARFIHTVRDPISGLNSWFERHMSWQFVENPTLTSRYVFPAYDTLASLLASDSAHRGAEERSWAVRFEDMHLALEATMRRVADWLPVAFRPSLLQSTLNGNPYVFEGSGGTWNGPNAANARRRSQNLHACDRWLVFALLHPNFKAWNYPSPKIFERRWVRLCAIAFLCCIPTKMELRNARELLRQQALPALRAGRIGYALGGPLHLIARRMRMICLIVLQAIGRETSKRRPIRML